MFIKEKVQIVLLFSLLLCSSLIAQNNTKDIDERINNVENGLSAQVHIKNEPYWNIQERMRKLNITGLSIAVINNYKVEWAKGYGLVNKEDNSLINKETVFQAASISKFVNATAIIKLSQIKNIDLDDDINNLLTSWQLPNNNEISNKPITLRKILSHTAGLSTHGFSGYKNDQNLPTLIEILNGTKPSNSERVTSISESGKEFKYSGGGTMISQQILLDLTDSTYESFIRENIFQPLDMNHSFYSIEKNKYPNKPAIAHIENGNPLKNNYNIYPESAAAGLWTTPSDLSKLIIDIQLALNNKPNKVLSIENTRKMMTPVLENELPALGVFIENYDGEKYFQHSGANNGFRSKFYASTANGQGVVVMTNSPNTEIMEEVIRSVSRVYNWPGINKNKEIEKEIKIPETILKNYLGKYSLNGNEKRIVNITFKKGNLIAQEKGKWKAILIPISNSNFIVGELKPKATLEFVTNVNGNVSKFIIHQDKSYNWIMVD